MKSMPIISMSLLLLLLCPAIHATNEHDAREKLLSITSQYGEFDMDEWTHHSRQHHYEMTDDDLKDELDDLRQEIRELRRNGKIVLLQKGEQILAADTPVTARGNERRQFLLVDPVDDGCRVNPANLAHFKGCKGSLCHDFTPFDFPY